MGGASAFGKEGIGIMNRTVLVTGGAGYIGSHTCVSLLEAGYDVIVADDLRNSKEESLRRVEQITGKHVPLYKIDVSDAIALDRVFGQHHFDAVIHFAGLKAVGESVAEPLMYYRNNLNATISLLECMLRHHVNVLVFSSSATVYRDITCPISEEQDKGCTNPYGWTKLMSEQIISDTAKTNPELSCILLRYFNPIGAHDSGLIGEDPNGIPNNLLPYIAKVAGGKLEKVHVFGNDYDTKDGTGVRDYIHVVDLAKGHLAALDYAFEHKGTEAFNLGTGKGYSVLEIIDAYRKASGAEIPYVIDPRRPGDVAQNYANPTRANTLLHWKAERDIANMCATSYHWQQLNPNGYEEK